MDILIAGIIALVIVVVAVVVAPTIKMALNIAPYLYTNTRCAAKTGMLLTKRSYCSLLATSYEKELYALLESTGYRHVVEHGHDFPSISPLLDKDLVDTYSWLEHVVPEKLRPIVLAMKKRFEIAEIKEAINRASQGEPVGEFKRIETTTLRLKLEGAQDLAGVINALEGSDYESLIQHGRIDPGALDAWYLVHVRDTIDAQDTKATPPFKEYWMRMIDLANIKVALRSAESTFTEGGYLAKEQVVKATSPAQLQDALAGTIYADINVTTLDEAERALQQSLRTAAGTISAKHPLHGGPIVRFLIEKELEIKNLNLIIKLKSERFTQQDIEPMVI